MYQKIAFLLALCAVVAQAFPDDSYMHPDRSKTHTKMQAEGDEPEYESSEFWRVAAQEALAAKLKQERIVKQAKNVIMFLGDGFGVSTVTAARILKGQKVDNVTFGEEAVLHMDTFPIIGTSKTFCTDNQVADSACSATAYLCGVKANEGTAGVIAAVKRGDCIAQQDKNNHVSSILAWAQAAGKSTGVVTTTRITHASPSGTYAHTANRDWESDSDVTSRGEDAEICDDIAEQLILMEPGKNIDVIFGGGRAKFVSREDGKDLTEIWKQQKTDNGANNVNASYIETATHLNALDPQITDSVLGLFASDHIEYYNEQASSDQPTLTDMTEKAIQILSKNPNGFFLFVEGGRIDHAHHENYGLRALWEAVEFDRAIKKGDDMTEDTETLIVVTADHSHAFSFAGYPDRGAPITGIAGNGEDDKLPWTTLNYANGPGWKSFENGARHNISEDGDTIHDLTYRQTPLVKLGSETHGGEDVLIFAKGPFSHLLTGVQQQSYIPHVMAYASCVGSGLTFCDNEGPTDQPTDQPTNQPTNQPTDQPTDKPTDEPSDKGSSTMNIASFLSISIILVLQRFL